MNVMKRKLEFLIVPDDENEQNLTVQLNKKGWYSRDIKKIKLPSKSGYNPT